MNTTSKKFTASDMQDLYDPAKRQSIQSNPRQYAEKIGVIVDGDTTTKVKVVACSSATMYMPFARIPAQVVLGSDDLSSIQAAGALGTGGTGATASTIGTVCTTASSATTLSTVGTAGSGS